MGVDGVAKVELEQVVGAQRDDQLGRELRQQVAVLHERVGVTSRHHLAPSPRWNGGRIRTGQHDHQHLPAPKSRRRRHRGLRAVGRAHRRCATLVTRNTAASRTRSTSSMAARRRAYTGVRMSRDRRWGNASEADEDPCARGPPGPRDLHPSTTRAVRTCLTDEHACHRHHRLDHRPHRPADHPALTRQGLQDRCVAKPDAPIPASQACPTPVR
jgi:hypothetical protein